MPRPKPKVEAPFTDDYLTDPRTLDRERQWFDLVHLALQTDSTRVIALWIWSHGRVDVPGVEIAHHDATHHGQDESKIKQLAAIEATEMSLFAGLLGKMKGTCEAGALAPRSDHRVLRQQPGERLGAHLRQPADPAGRRRLPATPGTWPSTARTISRSRTSSSACSTRWASEIGPLGTSTGVLGEV